jgi:hypothetical protein
MSKRRAAIHVLDRRELANYWRSSPGDQAIIRSAHKAQKRHVHLIEHDEPAPDSATIAPAPPGSTETTVTP